MFPEEKSNQETKKLKVIGNTLNEIHAWNDDKNKKALQQEQTPASSNFLMTLFQNNAGLCDQKYCKRRAAGIRGGSQRNC